MSGPTGLDPRSTGAPPPMRLVVVAGPARGQVITLVPGELTVGSAADNTLVLHDPLVSRHHLVIDVAARAVTARDLGSTNGSYCAGLRFTTLELRPGAIVELGTSALQFLPVTRPGERAISEREQIGELVGRSLPMRALFAMIERAGASGADVLVEGETGTGKELCAEALHAASPTPNGPYVICDLAGIPTSLVESELFGHLKGAFTGAISDRAGAFERAAGGTIFLDEVGELPLEVQPRLLRVLERRQFKRIGANDYQRASFRVIAATHRDLRADVEVGRFRQDLYQRLAVLRVRIPPLREHLEDLPLLVDTLLARLGKDPGELAPDTRRLLAAYDWPGNVRELRHVIERAVHVGQLDERVAAAAEANPPPAASAATDLVPFKEAKEMLVVAFERDYLAGLLRRFEHNVTEAARHAGIERAYLHRLLKKHGLDTR